MNFKYISGLGVALITTAFTSCNNNEFLPDQEEPKELISFETAEVNFTESRSNAEKIISSTVVEDPALGNISVELTESAGIESSTSRGNYLNGPNDFSVSAYLARTDEGYTTPNYFFNQKATRSSGKWATEEAHIWPGKGYKLRFFAVAPFDHQQKSIEKDARAVPALTVGLSSSAKEQKDILVACEEISNATSGSIFLQFQHIMSAIKVKFEAGIFADCQIFGVTIANACLGGVYFPNQTIASQAGVWQVLPTSQGVVNSNVTMNVDEIYASSSVELDLLTGDDMFMMIPQSTQDISIAIHYSKNKEAGEGSQFGTSLTMKLPAGKWLPGHTYSYILRR